MRYYMLTFILYSHKGDLELSQEDTTRPLRSNHESIQEAGKYDYRRYKNLHTYM